MGEAVMAYLERRFQTYLAFHDIPEDVQGVIGRKRFSQSLKTADKGEAKRRKAELEAKWLGDIQRARTALTAGVADIDALHWRHVLRSAPEDEQDGVRERIREEARDKVLAAAIARGIYDYNHPEFETLAAHKEAKRFEGIATGVLVQTSEHMDEYLATLRLAPKTMDIKRANITRFADRFPLTSDVRRREVQRWVNEQQAAGKTSKTLQRDLSDIRGYWAYLQSLQVVSEEAAPLDKLTLARGDGGPKRKALAAAEVVRLLDHAAGPWEDPTLADLIRLGMWTGARLEELCALRTEHVHADHFEVVDAKTQAGIRKVPIHPKLAPTLKRLVQDSKDGFVLTKLTLNKYGDRSNAIGKRFGRLKTELGFGPEHVFHSIRKTVATQLENAGVRENVAADILGHEKPTMTYGLYSGGSSIKTMAKAIAKLAYPGQ